MVRPSRTIVGNCFSFQNSRIRCRLRELGSQILLALRTAAPRLLQYVLMTNRTGYTEDHAKSGLDHRFPDIDTWPNQFPAYEIVIDVPEFTSVCPKTGLPDFGVLEIRYVPDQLCLELKSLKEYLTEYRNLGIFQENIVNQVLEDVVRAAKPKSATIRGIFRPRGGIGTTVVATWPRG
jgi:7-cyano-7-deazaguanine reductase